MVVDKLRFKPDVSALEELGEDRAQKGLDQDFEDGEDFDYGDEDENVESDDSEIEDDINGSDQPKKSKK